MVETIYPDGMAEEIGGLHKKPKSDRNILHALSRQEFDRILCYPVKNRDAIFVGLGTVLSFKPHKEINNEWSSD